MLIVVFALDDTASPVWVLNGRPGFAQRHREQPPAAGLVAGARRRDLAAERRHRRRVDGREALGQRAGDIPQLKPRQRRGEGHVEMAAAARRNVGDVPGAEALEQLGELGRLATDVTAGNGS